MKTFKKNILVLLVIIADVLVITGIIIYAQRLKELFVNIDNCNYYIIAIVSVLLFSSVLLTVAVIKEIKKG